MGRESRRSLFIESVARSRFDEERGDAKHSDNKQDISPVEWCPDLNPTQKRMFFDDAPYIYAHGPRGTGKGIGLLHKGIRHCYETPSALWLIVTRTARQSVLGLKPDMERIVMPQWIDGIGLKFIPFMMDGLTKDWNMWIQSAHDEEGQATSQVVMMSVPHLVQLAQKCKALSPSMIYIDELTEFESREIIEVLSQQLGRRKGMLVPQQLTASMNPKGEGHWAYKELFVNHVDQETGEYDPNVSVYQVPLLENLERLEEGYYEKFVIPAVKSNPIEYMRLVEGKWIDKPSSRTLLAPFLDEGKHIVGCVKSGLGLTPVPNVPIIVGMDPGVKWTGVVFAQHVVGKSGSFWIVFDEIALNDYHTHKYLAKRLVAKMDKWNKEMGREMQYLFVSDSSALNQFRSGEDRYDAVALMRHSEGRIKRIMGVDKPSGSKKMRVSVTQDLLARDMVYISATCQSTCNMVRYLECDKNDPDIPKRQENTHIHMFDALSYIFYKFETTPSLDSSHKKSPPKLIHCG